MTFRKSQHFDLLGGQLPVLSDRSARKQSAASQCQQLDRVSVDGHQGVRMAPWLEYATTVLCFLGYFQETTLPVDGTAYQIRQVRICYFPEDDTVQIVEPRILNSGIAQGCIVKRQRVTETTGNPEAKRFISLLDLNVGRTVRIFDRSYHITDCDSATRQFLQRLGIKVPQKIQTPIDPATERRRLQEEWVLKGRKKAAANTKDPKYRQFLKHHRQVLKFDAYWDDRNSEFGDLRHLVVHYYLADDTVEIKETFPVNSGRPEGGSGIFLKRMRLPKGDHQQSMLDIGQSAAFTVLNVIGSDFNAGRYMPDSAGGPMDGDYYRYTDLRLGIELSVFGRRVILTDCDGFTRDFYRDQMGIEEFPVVNGHKLVADVSAILPPPPPVDLPPFNGWGTHADSAGNCRTVEPKPPPIDFDKFVRLDGLMLRFGAKLMAVDDRGTDGADNQRIFIVTYYLQDDTVAVYEVPVRNSGFSGGQFMRRRKFYLPGEDLRGGIHPPRAYTAQHFYVGATVLLHGHRFRIISADRFAFAYTEANCGQFPFANVASILDKIRCRMGNVSNYKACVAKYWTQIQAECGENPGKSIIVSFDLIRQLLYEIFAGMQPPGITEHEILTVCRHFEATKQVKVGRSEGGDDGYNDNRQLIRAVVHAELHRNLWQERQRLAEYIQHITQGDASVGSGVGLEGGSYVTEATLRTIIRGAKLPLSPDQVTLMLNVLETNAAGHISVADFMAFLQVDVTCLSYPVPTAELNRSHSGQGEQQQVDWNRFLEAIGLEERLKQETS